MKKRRNEEPIDEELLMRMMAGEKVRSDGNGGAEDTEEGETGRRGTAVPMEKMRGGKTANAKRCKPRQTSDYETTYLKGMDIPARYGKPVYVRREYHERIAKISVMLTGGRVSLSA